MDDDDAELDGLELNEWVELAETQLAEAEAADDVDAIKATLPLLYNCIERSAALYGAGSSRLFDHRVRLAGALQMIGHLDDAVEQLRACVAASVAASDESESDYRFHLAAILEDCGEAAEACVELRQCLALREVNLGEENPDTLITIAYLAEACQRAAYDGVESSVEAAAALAEAEALLRRALALHESAFGEDDPKTQLCMSNLAGLLQDVGRLEESEALLRRDLGATLRAFGGDEHDEPVASMSNLADVLLERGGEELRAEAEALLRRCFAAAIILYGEADEVTIYARANVGRSQLTKVGDPAAVALGATAVAAACEELRCDPHRYRDDHRWLRKLDAARVQAAVEQQLCIACGAPPEEKGFFG